MADEHLASNGPPTKEMLEEAARKIREEGIKPTGPVIVSPEAAKSISAQISLMQKRIDLYHMANFGIISRDEMVRRLEEMEKPQ